MREDSQLDSMTQALAKKLHAERERQELSKNELSQRAGISRQAIRLIEEGERQPGIYTLLLLAKALDVKLWQIIKDIEEPKKRRGRKK